MSAAATDPHNPSDRMLFMYLNFVGQVVEAQMADGHIIEGIFVARNNEAPFDILMAKTRYKASTACDLTDSCKPRDWLRLKADDVIVLRATNIQFRGERPHVIDEGVERLRSDMMGRELKSWADADAADFNHSLDDHEHREGVWNQFDQNLPTSYDENIYTTSLDHSKFSQEQIEHATRLTREIEGGRSLGIQHELERGGGHLKDFDEGALYSDVQRSGSSAMGSREGTRDVFGTSTLAKAGGNKYVPPSSRKKDGPALVAPMPSGEEGGDTKGDRMQKMREMERHTAGDKVPGVYDENGARREPPSPLTPAGTPAVAKLNPGAKEFKPTTGGSSTPAPAQPTKVPALLNDVVIEESIISVMSKALQNKRLHPGQFCTDWPGDDAFWDEDDEAYQPGNQGYPSNVHPQGAPGGQYGGYQQHQPGGYPPAGQPGYQHQQQQPGMAGPSPGVMPHQQGNFGPQGGPGYRGPQQGAMPPGGPTATGAPHQHQHSHHHHHQHQAMGSRQYDQMGGQMGVHHANAHYGSQHQQYGGPTGPTGGYGPGYGGPQMAHQPMHHGATYGGTYGGTYGATYGGPQMHGHVPQGGYQGGYPQPHQHQHHQHQHMQHQHNYAATGAPGPSGPDPNAAYGGQPGYAPQHHHQHMHQHQPHQHAHQHQGGAPGGYGYNPHASGAPSGAYPPQQAPPAPHQHHHQHQHGQHQHAHQHQGDYGVHQQHQRPMHADPSQYSQPQQPLSKQPMGAPANQGGGSPAPIDDGSRGKAMGGRGAPMAPARGATKSPNRGPPVGSGAKGPGPRKGSGQK